MLFLAKSIDMPMTSCILSKAEPCCFMAIPTIRERCMHIHIGQQKATAFSQISAPIVPTSSITNYFPVCNSRRTGESVAAFRSGPSSYRLRPHGGLDQWREDFPANGAGCWPQNDRTGCSSHRHLCALHISTDPSRGRAIAPSDVDFM